MLANGIFNLNPGRAAIFREIARVLRPGAMVAGARDAGAFLDEFRDAGFSQARITRTLRNARTKHPAVLAADYLAVR